MTGLILGGFFIIIAMLIVAIAALYSRLMESKDQQITQLQAALEKLQVELDDLKGRKRQTGPTIAGLEDLSAQLSQIKLNRAVEDTILTACLNTAHELRQGPYAYDPEKPSGEGKNFA